MDAERTKAAYQLLCETFPAVKRADLCATLAALRAALADRAAFMRIRRLWMARVAANAELGTTIRRAIEAERDR